MNSPKRNAFTIIELLIVVAVIALLMSILLPALAKARLAAQRAVSAANLASLARVQATYGAEYKDSFVNMFDPLGRRAAWHFVVRPSYTQIQADRVYGLDTASLTRCTERFAFGWTNMMLDYFDDHNVNSRVQIDPADPYLTQRYREMDKAAGDPNTIGPDPDPLLGKEYTTSYLYPPLFWLRAERYKTDRLVNIGPADSHQLARNRFDMVPNPACKVLLMERFDTGQKRRISGGKVQAAPPQWNNPAASPQVATTDGSVTTSRTRAVHTLGESTDPKINAVFRPSGYWAPEPAFLSESDLEKDPFETGWKDTSAWRQYFWATRNGVRGMDIRR